MARPRVLVVSHDPTMVAGVVGDLLVEAGCELDPFVVLDDPDDPVSHRPFPALDGYGAVVVMGSPWSVDDPAIASWIGRELTLLRDAHARDVAVLGICFGAQALAVALGGSIGRAPAAEIGWFEVDTDAPDVVAPGPWLQWHRDAFGVPPGAVELARSPAGPQAFVTGRSLAVQFHPEIDEATMRVWLGADEVRDPDLEARGLTRLELLAQTARHAAPARANTERLVAAFVRRARLDLSGHDRCPRC